MEEETELGLRPLQLAMVGEGDSRGGTFIEDKKDHGAGGR